jgi:hypothetical protein
MIYVLVAAAAGMMVGAIVAIFWIIGALMGAFMRR